MLRVWRTLRPYRIRPGAHPSRSGRRRHGAEGPLGNWCQCQIFGEILWVMASNGFKYFACEIGGTFENEDALKLARMAALGKENHLPARFARAAEGNTVFYF